jgi:hypothetical protein
MAQKYSEVLERFRCKPLQKVKKILLILFACRRDLQESRLYIYIVKIRRTAEAYGYEEPKFLRSSLITLPGNLNWLYIFMKGILAPNT